MENRFNKKNRRKHNLKVHIVLVTKYRKGILKNSYINNDLKNKISDVCNNNNCQIIAMKTDKDHIHLLLCYDATICVADIVKILKQETIYYLWQKYYDTLIKQYWKKKDILVRWLLRV